MSGASTMRNAVKRVTHKERAQPSSRKKFGLLEKHKDYVERAKDYKNKQSHLTKLRKKALDRNPDEFYFKMNSSQVVKGIHKTTKNANSAVDNSVISTLKTQDLGYITAKKCADDSKIRKLKENLHLIGEQKVKNHKVFVDSESELRDFDPAVHFDTAPELVSRSFNRPRLLKSTSTSGDASENHSSDGMVTSTGGRIDPRCVATSLTSTGSKRNKGAKKATPIPAAYKELRERVKRSKNLRTAIDKLSLQRLLTNSKGSKRKVVIPNPAGGNGKDTVVYKWKRERAR